MKENNVKKRVCLYLERFRDSKKIKMLRDFHTQYQLTSVRNQE